MTKLHLRPETKTKLRKIREDLEKELKADAEKDKKEEVHINKKTMISLGGSFADFFYFPKLEQAVQDRKAAKKRAEEERISKLSAAEQRKVRYSSDPCLIIFDFFYFDLFSIVSREGEEEIDEEGPRSRCPEMSSPSIFATSSIIKLDNHDYISDTLLPTKYNNPNS